MSKIGKKPITIPSGVQVSFDNGLVQIKGPKGEFKKDIPGSLSIDIKDNSLSVSIKEGSSSKDEKKNKALWGLYRSLLSNYLTGVSSGFEEVLEFEGVGYKAAVKGKDLELNLGYSHPITIIAPPGIIFSTEKDSIKISGFDKELIGQVAFEIRSKRFPEPYQGSGIRYRGEVIRRKAGKKAATAGA